MADDPPPAQVGLTRPCNMVIGVPIGHRNASTVLRPTWPFSDIGTIGASASENGETLSNCVAKIRA